MPDAIDLQAKAAEPSPDVINQLTHLLAEAKAGRIRAFMIGYTVDSVDSVGRTMWCAPTGKDKMLMFASYHMTARGLADEIEATMESEIDV